MIENVYVIKVKTKPPLSSLYPSERRYSASTVGGLSFVHFGLGALSLLLGTLALSLQGPILSVACLVPFVTGLLAWRRWYIDRNITIFFYGNLFSLIIASLCFVATSFDIAAAFGARGSFWSLKEILESPQYDVQLNVTPSKNTSTEDSTLNSPNLTDFEQALRIHSEAFTNGIIFDNMSNISGYILRTTGIADPLDDNYNEGNGTSNFDELEGQASLIYERKSLGDDLHEKDFNVTEETYEVIKSDVESFWRKNYENPAHNMILLTVNVLVASLLEIFWSALSARIAFRGMTNRLPESSYANNVVGSTKTGGTRTSKKKTPAPKPDILDHDERLSERLQNLNALHHFQGSGPRLPLPESSREFRERMERFLANQAAHMMAEGSCT